MTDYSEKRRQMVDSHLVGRGIRDPAVLAAFRTVPREEFVSRQMASLAYADIPLPIGEGQTISQPYVVALMTEALELEPTQRVLEVGTGSGYGAAILSCLAAAVYTIERHRALARAAARRLARLGYHNVRVRHGDGSLGWPEHAPFDAIVVTAGGPRIPEALRQQLALGGRLVMPVGSRYAAQELVRLRRVGPDSFEEENLGLVRFVPLVGAQGWTDEPAPASGAGASAVRQG